MTSSDLHGVSGMQHGRLRHRDRRPLSDISNALCVCSLVAATQLCADADVLDVMQDELNRSFKVLQEEPTPPYYLSYEITESASANISASFGEVINRGSSTTRYIDINLRVGDFSLDNTHPVEGGTVIPDLGAYTIAIDDVDALRTTLWYRTDMAFKTALSQFTRVRNRVQTTVEADDKSGDFSVVEPSTYIEEKRELDADMELWGRKLQEYTHPFATSPVVQTNSASISGEVETRWFVNTDGSRVLVSQPYYRMVISATAKADDGMVLGLVRTFDSVAPDRLLKDEEVLATVNTMIDELKALREAPLVDPYTGPALLSGRATGVFLHEVLGHPLEGHRQKSEDESQTFRKQVGEQLLPEGFSVVFDPSMEVFGETDLIGNYKFDNEGVRGQRVVVIDNGVLKGFLMSRAPIEGYPESNGHGRKQIGHAVVARQSNLLLEVDDPVSSEELEAMLLEQVEEQGKEFGLYFKDITGGFTTTQRNSPSAFNVTPVLVYKIYRDGSKELVRGVNLIGTPLATLSEVKAGATDIEIFNGICGGESGSVPVSAVAPSILISQIEVQKAEISRDIPPILPSPVDNSSAQLMNSTGDTQ